MKNIKINIYEASTGVGMGETQSSYEVDKDLANDPFFKEYKKHSNDQKVNIVIAELIDQVSNEIRRLMKPSLPL